jgi:8-oxo-dGTP pyrophosphatase MutT (NUDIX family)
MSPENSNFNVNELREKLNGKGVNVTTEWSAKPAAVLVPFYWENEQWNLLFTRRRDHLHDHGGQVSFPGGSIEAQDKTPEDAARRELEEEVGIARGRVSVLGRLDALFTVTQFLIHPILATIPWPTDINPNSAEVARVFGVPLKWLANPQNLEEKNHILPLSGKNMPVYYFKEYDGEIIWGATARITTNLIDVLGLK